MPEDTHDKEKKMSKSKEDREKEDCEEFQQAAWYTLLGPINRSWSLCKQRSWGKGEASRIWEISWR